jgi:hypothetical protein
VDADLPAALNFLVGGFRLPAFGKLGLGLAAGSLEWALAMEAREPT